MKVQCPCGTKLSFDITPETAQNGLVVRCPNCNTDLTAAVAPFVQEALASMSNAPRPAAVAPPPVKAVAPPPQISRPVPTTAPSAPVASSAPSAPAPPKPPSGAGAARLHVHSAAASAPSTATATSAPSEPAGPICVRHSGEVAHEKCRVCNKPICPRCMTQFGFVCSAYCQGKAENLGVDVPEYAGQNKNVNARSNRMFKLSLVAAFLVLFLIIGAWGLNEFYLSQPRIVFSVPLTKSVSPPSGRWGDAGSYLVLHEGVLTRYAVKTKQPVWAVTIVGSNDFSASARAEAPKVRAEYAFWRSEQLKKPKQYDYNGHEIWYDEVPTEEEQYQKLLTQKLDHAKSSLHLLGEGTNIWIAIVGQLGHFRWDDGSRDKLLPLDVSGWLDGWSGGKQSGNSLSTFDRLPNGDRKFTRLNLLTGETEEKIFPAPPRTILARAGNTNASSKATTVASRKPGPTGAGAAAIMSGKGGAATSPVANPRGPGVARTTAASRADLPAIPKGLSGPEAAIAAIQLQANTKLEAALEDDDEIGPRKRHAELSDLSRVEWQMSDGKLLKLTSMLVEFKPVIRKNLKDPPKKSALNSAPSIAQTTEIANEILNEMRRDKTDGVTVDDKSPYRVTLRYADEPETAGWSGEVVGSPSLYILPSANVVVADTAVIVLDKSNKKLWETTLTYPLARRATSATLDLGDPESGGGPVIEHENTLYILDPGVVGAFDKLTGAVRWRLPTVGASSLQFDKQGSVYINTTSMGQDQLRFEEQVDISKKDRLVIIKADVATGRIRWKATNCGQIAAMIGDQIYTSEVVTTGLGVLRQEAVSHLLLCKLNSKTGKIKWEHSSRGAPGYLGIQGTKILVVRHDKVDLYTYGMFE